jgi:hypothetical protein
MHFCVDSIAATLADGSRSRWLADEIKCARVIVLGGDTVLGKRCLDAAQTH